MRAWLKKAAGYLAAFFAGLGAALAFIVVALLGRGENFNENDDGPLDTDRDLAEAAKRAAIDRAIDRARERSKAHADRGGAGGNPHPGD